MTKVIEGIVHGRMIELQDDPGLPDGQVVRVVIRADAGAEDREAALRAAAGALAHLPAEDWEALERIVEERQNWTYRDPVE